jgi:hypothetical protein
MTSRWSLGTRSALMIGVTMLAEVVLGCGPATVPSGGTGAVAMPAGGSAASAPASPEPAATSPLTAGGPSPTVAGRDAPPDALLSAEGGDPVVGQLGTYIWFESGSDAPWLPGAPLAVGAGEPLTVSLVLDGDIRAWSARYVPANSAGPDGATSLGEGAGDPAFAAPGPGSWTVELSAEFAAGAGNAHYFWRLEVE